MCCLADGPLQSLVVRGIKDKAAVSKPDTAFLGGKAGTATYLQRPRPLPPTRAACVGRGSRSIAAPPIFDSHASPTLARAPHKEKRASPLGANPLF